MAHQCIVTLKIRFIKANEFLVTIPFGSSTCSWGHLFELNKASLFHSDNHVHNVLLCLHYALFCQTGIQPCLNNVLSC